MWARLSSSPAVLNYLQFKYKSLPYFWRHFSLLNIHPKSNVLNKETEHRPIRNIQYNKFGHEETKESKFTKFMWSFIGIGLFCCVFNWKGYYKYFFRRVDAAEIVQDVNGKTDHNESLSENGNETEDTDKKTQSSIKSKNKSSGNKKSGDGGKGKSESEENASFRGKKLTEQIVEYENRVRQYSTPDKVFRYFATLKLAHVSGEYSEVFMTPDDFLRSMTPGDKQPDGLGLDQYKKYEPKSGFKLELALDEDSIFYKLGSSGLISFSDYVFLLTVLSTSRRHFEIAFRMFDLNGDGNVDYEEFDKVTTLIRQQTNIGTRHRDHANTGNCFKGVNSGLATYFFGKNRKGKLTIEKFLEFQQKLQNEILSLEYSRRIPLKNGNISEIDFCDLLLVHAGYPERKKEKMLKRVSKSFKHSEVGVSLDDYLKFFHFLNNINDVELALEFYYLAGASVDQVTFKHVAKTVAHVNLSDHLVNVVFTLFDENLDGQLSYTEFVAVMKHRLLRGLEKPKDTKFIKVMQSLFKCALESKPILLSL